MNLTTVTALIS